MAVLGLAGVGSAGVGAVELGELSVASKSGERFDGRIALVGAEGVPRRNIAVTLGSEADFGTIGLERRDYLESLRFRVEPPHVLISSGAPIPDAYLSFLVRLTWPEGTSLRAYSAVLNAPGAAAAVPPAPVSAKPPGPSTSAPARRTVTVRPQDTLWSIAAANLPDGMNVQQHMLAILEQNPDAFVAGNINGLVAGATLRLPNGTAPDSLSLQEAFNEAERQNESWGADGSGQLTIIDLAEEGQATGAAGQPLVREPRKPGPAAEPPSATESPPAEDAVADPPPPPLANLLQEARRQVREQARQMAQRDDEIARLNSELAALQARRDQERQEWMETLARWRIAALAGLLLCAALIAVGLVAWRRRRGASSADSPAAPDYEFGAPIRDGQVKLNLAKAHIDLGDRANARELLEEVVAGGTDEERNEAQALLEQLAEGPSQPVQS